ncbi:MAG: hypothetical protein MJ198_00265 [Bacteroidales bacterium]|nr:hypothetical protein [Bacteroidales bacterium]
MGLFDFFYSSNFDSNVKTFVFHSTKHQRYESDVPVMGLQICGRTLSLEKNVNGCSGYRLREGYGYIVRGQNDDIGREQFAPKPMEVIKQSKDYVLLRGYMTQAMGPFGWIDFDLSDYGFEVFYENGIVQKCVLHMYDRNVRIEYLK